MKVMDNPGFISNYNRYLRSRTQMKELSIEKENSIIDRFAKTERMHGSKDNTMVVGVVRNLSILNDVLDNLIHLFMIGQEKKQSISFACAKAYVSVMYCIPYLLQVDRVNFMYQVNEYTLQKLGETKACDIYRINDMRNCLKMYSINTLIMRLCNAFTGLDYSYTSIVQSCADVIAIISILMCSCGFGGDTLDFMVEVILRFIDREYKEPEYKQK